MLAVDVHRFGTNINQNSPVAASSIPKTASHSSPGFWFPSADSRPPTLRVLDVIDYALDAGGGEAEGGILVRFGFLRIYAIASPDQQAAPTGARGEVLYAASIAPAAAPLYETNECNPCSTRCPPGSPLPVSPRGVRLGPRLSNRGTRRFVQTRVHFASSSSSSVHLSVWRRNQCEERKLSKTATN